MPQRPRPDHAGPTGDVGTTFVTTRVPLPAAAPAPALPLRHVPPTRVAVRFGAGQVASPRSRLRLARAAVAVATTASSVAFLAAAVAYVATFTVEGSDPRGPGAPVTALQVSRPAVDRLIDTGAWASTTGDAAAVAVCLAFVLVVRWQNVVLRNQRPLGVVAPWYGPWRAALAWIVPFWCLYGPKQAYDDAWRAAALHGVPIEPERGTDREKVPLVFTVWWGSWVLAGVLRVFALRSPLDIVGDRLTLQGLDAVSSASLTVAGLSFLAVMGRISARHEAAVAGAGAGQPTDDAPPTEDAVATGDTAPTEDTTLTEDTAPNKDTTPTEDDRPTEDGPPA